MQYSVEYSLLSIYIKKEEINRFDQNAFSQFLLIAVSTKSASNYYRANVFNFDCTGTHDLT